MAFVATAPEAAPGGTAEATLGVARATADPDNVAAEFGIVVRSDLKGGGLGRVLMQALIDHQRERGTQWLRGTVLRENTRMLALARELGFTLEAPDADEGTVAVTLALQR
jgi:acetyltransferase